MIWQILRTVIITTARKAKLDNLAISDHFRRVYAGDGFYLCYFTTIILNRRTKAIHVIRMKKIPKNGKLKCKCNNYSPVRFVMAFNWI